MFSKIAGFEFRYQLRNPVFWVAAGIFFLLTFGAGQQAWYYLLCPLRRTFRRLAAAVFARIQRV